ADLASGEVQRLHLPRRRRRGKGLPAHEREEAVIIMPAVAPFGLRLASRGVEAWTRRIDDARAIAPDAEVDDVRVGMGQGRAAAAVGQGAPHLRRAIEALEE